MTIKINALNELTSYYEANDLRANTLKTQLCTFHSSTKKQNASIDV